MLLFHEVLTKKGLFFSVAFILVLSLVLFVPRNSAAKVTGTCSNCHTMHNSQGGTAMATGELPPGDTAPHQTLLINSCVGCHASGTSSETYSLGGCNVPVVYYTGGSAPDTYLAGGNFWWVAQGDDAKGHNVFSDNADSINFAPGNDNPACNGNGSCHISLHDTNTNIGSTGLRNRQGCTKCHMISDDNAPKGFHHADDTTDAVTGGNRVTTAAQGWYRFLSGHRPQGTGHGATGVEDADWQASSDSSDHNEYLGNNAASKTSRGGFATCGDTMTGFCTGCHRDFHIEDSGGSWIRHPSDTVLPTGGEYAAYTTYDPLVPVARSSLDNVSSSVSGGDGDMVMCLSCHRPHGSPYDDMLRWDYDDMIAGDSGKSGGCFTCHTQKNDAG